MQNNCLSQVFIDKNQASGIWDPQNKPIASIKDIQEKTTLEFQLLYPNTLGSISPQSKLSCSQMTRFYKNLGDNIYNNPALNRYENLTSRDLSHIIYYKCDKNKYFADKYIKSMDNALQK